MTTDRMDTAGAPAPLDGVLERAPKVVHRHENGGLAGLQAVLRLHIAQEDEAYLSLFEPSSTAGTAARDGHGPQPPA